MYSINTYLQEDLTKRLYNLYKSHVLITVRSMALVCSSAGSISLSEHYFTQSHSWAQSCPSEYFPPPSHFGSLIAILRLFKAIQGNSRQFQACPGYFTIFQSIPVHFNLCQSISTNSILVIAGCGSASLKLCV